MQLRTAILLMGVRTAILLGVLLVAPIGAVQADPNAATVEPNAISIAPHWSVEVGMGLGASDENLVLGSAMYWPNYAADGAVGVLAVGGDQIPEDEFAAGPCVEFPTGKIYTAATAAIIPDKWAAFLSNMTAQVRPYGRVAVLFDPDFEPIAVVGTGLRLFPNGRVQPTLHTDYLTPSGSSDCDLSGWVTSFSVGVFF